MSNPEEPADVGHPATVREDAPGARGAWAELTADMLPPGPRVPALVQSVGLLGFRHQFVPAMKRRYGDVFSLRLLPEGRWLVVFHKPDAVKEIFAGDPAVFHAGKGNAILGPVMGEHSLLLVDGAAHKRARKLLMPAFNGHALRGYQEVVTGLAKTEVGTWRAGEEFRSLDRMNALTLEVILQVVFGVTDEQRLAELRPLVNRTVNIHPLVFLGWGLPRLQSVGPWRRTVENQEQLDRVIYAEIASAGSRPTSPSAPTCSRTLPRPRRRAGSAAHRRRAPRPAGHAAARRSRDHRDRAVVGPLRGRPRPGPAGQGAHGRARGRRRLPRGRAQGVDAAPPGDPDGGPDPDEPGHGGGIDLPAGATVGPSIILAHAHPDNHPEPERVPARAVRRGAPATQHLDPVRRRRTPLHRRRLLADGGRRGPARGALVVRRDRATGSTDVPKVRNITSVPRHGARIVVTPR